MKIQIEKQIEVFTQSTMEGLNAIIECGLTSGNIPNFMEGIKEDDRVLDIDFFIYKGSTHIAVHEILANGDKSERLLIITQ